MYVEHVSVSNVKLLRDVELSFVGSDGALRMWTVFVGDNGLCKTTLLQSIALAAAGTDRANQMADVPSFPDRRQEAARVSIHGTYRVGGSLDGDAGTLHTTARKRRVDS